jgi:hypothetical protein
MNFTGDMKKIGMVAAINDVKENQIKIRIKCRHISPPPYMNGGDAGGDAMKIETEGMTTEDDRQDQSEK